MPGGSPWRLGDSANVVKGKRFLRIIILSPSVYLKSFPHILSFWVTKINFHQLWLWISFPHLAPKLMGAGGERDDRGWDGWMASPTRWTWVWVNSRSWWWTGRPGVLWFMGLQRVGHDWETELTDWLMPYSGYIILYSVMYLVLQYIGKIIMELEETWGIVRKKRPRHLTLLPVLIFFFFHSFSLTFFL